MYVYLIKCSIYYKIGFSKNPKNRVKTVKTHNPLDVVLFATLKTDNYLILEKELHSIFANKNSKREWFELNEDDLTLLKINYGFNFLIPINSINNNKIKNKEVLSEVKEIRINNNKIDYVITYFEELFDVVVKNKKTIKKCCLKFESKTIIKAINNLYSQNQDAEKSLSLLYKVCDNINQMDVNPSKHVVKIIKAIMYKQFNCSLSYENCDYLLEKYNTELEHDEVIKDLNSKKFYLSEDDFFKYIIDKYTE